MLTCAKLTRFRSILSSSKRIPFAPLTILVGEQGAGKSTVVSAQRWPIVADYVDTPVWRAQPQRISNF